MQERISIGGVIKETVALLSRNRVVFGGLGLLLGFLPTFLFGFLRVVGVFEASNDTAAALSGSPGENIATTIAGLFLQASLIEASLADIKGRRLGFSESLSAGQRHWLPLLGIGILSGLGVVAGTLLFIVPGVLLYLRWLVAPAVRVSERKGVFESLGRSAELTRDNRWRLLGLTLLTVLIIGGAIVALTALLITIPEHLLLATIISELVLAPTIVMAVSVTPAVGVAVTYAQLRRVKGSPLADIAAVFD